ncbi:hypothetical protein XPA_002043 [Xanthoria parietina]
MGPARPEAEEHGAPILRFSLLHLDRPFAGSTRAVAKTPSFPSSFTSVSNLHSTYWDPLFLANCNRDPVALQSAVPHPAASDPSLIPAASNPLEPQRLFDVFWEVTTVLFNFDPTYSIKRLALARTHTAGLQTTSLQFYSPLAARYPGQTHWNATPKDLDFCSAELRAIIATGILTNPCYYFPTCGDKGSSASHLNHRTTIASEVDNHDEA